MMRLSLLMLTGVLTAAIPSRGETVMVPYTGGKLVGAFTVMLDNGANISPDTVQFGSVFGVAAYLSVSPLTVCNNSHELGFFVLTDGIVRRRFNRDTSWSSYDAYPLAVSSIINVDSVPKHFPEWEENPEQNRGYPFAMVGDYDCVSEMYDFIDSTYRQVVFVQSDEAFAKLQIASHHDTAYGTPTSPFNILKSITLRYVISDDPDDLVDPGVSIRVPRRWAGSVEGDAVEYYNPLGIRVRPEAGRPAPALPVPRTRPAEPSDR